jgi:CYTH domain-containing protein
MSKLTPGKEFERKFLVRAPQFTDAIRRTARQLRIRQGYLALAPMQVRVRHTHGEGYVLEIKGPDDLEIDCGQQHDADGRIMMENAAKVASIIEKVRYEVPAGFDGLKWEVDLFKGDNAPLLVAEIEMPEKDYPLDARELPAWLGEEVTDEPHFKNKNLAVRPFTHWPKSLQKKTLKRMGL